MFYYQAFWVSMALTQKKKKKKKKNTPQGQKRNLELKIHVKRFFFLSKR